MDKAKLRLFAGLAAGVLAFCGLIALTVAGAIALSNVMDTGMAVALIAVIFLGLSGLCFGYFLLPNKSIDEELEQAEKASSEYLADLPIDTLKQFVRKHPMTAASIALAIGYGFIRDPQSATRHAQTALFRFL